jgi:hypothetical protein
VNEPQHRCVPGGAEVVEIMQKGKKLSQNPVT